MPNHRPRLDPQDPGTPLTDPLDQQWPPEVPPFRPPVTPTPTPAPPSPGPILPSWEEPSPLERDLAERLLEQRIVTVSGRLDEALANRATSRLLLLGQSAGEAITLHLSCNDSELGPSLALADAVDLVDAPVHTVVHGTLRGPAVAVLCAAAERSAHRHALIVLSVPDTSVEGTAAQLASRAEQHLHQVAQLRDRIAEVTGRPAQEVAADLDAGRVLSAEEAREYGLVQQVR